MVDRPKSLLNRREVLRIGAVGAGGLVAQSLVAPTARADSGSASMIEVAGQPLETVRVGFVGVGLQGTRGLAHKYPEPGGIHVEGMSEPHTWDAVDGWLERFDHPLWRRLEDASRGAGHGGMDFIEDLRLVEALRFGRPPDSDVYDAATLSAVIELSGRSIARGRWREARPLHMTEVASSS